MFDTRLGAIHYSESDVFHFNDGLAGFPNNTKFALTRVPGVQEGERYNLLQSLEDSALSFILYYPALDETQQADVLSNVQKMLGDGAITRDEVGFALLVVINNDASGQTKVTFVEDAPLVFSSKTQEAWQLVNMQ